MSADINADSNMPTSIVDAQVQRLLEVVNEYQQQQCDELLDHAHAQSRKIIRQAFRNARSRVHHDIQASRQNMQQELAATRAKQHTFMMQERHRRDQDFLNQAWSRLADQLQARWREQKQRKSWVQNIVQTALKVLPGKTWQVDCPADWPKAEQDELLNAVNKTGKREVSISGVKDIVAGIRISADAALVDGTLEGLMADRGRIESEMLARRKQLLASREAES